MSNVIDFMERRKQRQLQEAQAAGYEHVEFSPHILDQLDEDNRMIEELIKRIKGVINRFADSRITADHQVTINVPLHALASTLLSMIQSMDFQLEDEERAVREQYREKMADIIVDTVSQTNRQVSQHYGIQAYMHDDQYALAISLFELILKNRHMLAHAQMRKDGFHGAANPSATEDGSV